MNIARRCTFGGRPVITAPTVLGCPPDKPYLYRIPVIGARPLEVKVTGLPKGLTFENQTICGTPLITGCFDLKVTAGNAEGEDEKTVRLEIYPHNNQRTPLMGFTSWNAFCTFVTQQDMLDTVKQMTDSGLCDYGYNYINLDSSWQGEYGGKYDAVQPNEKFPDMKGMVDAIHAAGFRAGIYSSPFIRCYGASSQRKFLPGCTVGATDFRTGKVISGVGAIHKERNNVAQWTEWGFDYLKYDWRPTDTINADLMRRALDESPRDFVYCVTIRTDPHYADYWMRYVNSYRDNEDAVGNWEKTLSIYNTYNQWQNFGGHGHYYDLDMLDIGKMKLGECLLTENEKIFAYSMRAFMTSPIQISFIISETGDSDLDLCSNEEVIAINQDGLLIQPKCVFDEKVLRIYEKPLESGDTGIGVFNSSEEEKTVEYGLSRRASVRDVWAKEDLGKTEKLCVTLPPHSARIFRIGK